MLRNMIYVPRLPDERAEAHMTRCARLLRKCRANHKLPHGDATYFASYFSWCGHIAHITMRDPKGGNQHFVSAQKYGMASEPPE